MEDDILKSVDIKDACSDPQPHTHNFSQTYGDCGIRS